VVVEQRRYSRAASGRIGACLGRSGLREEEGDWEGKDGYPYGTVQRKRGRRRGISPSGYLVQNRKIN